MQQEILNFRKEKGEVSMIDIQGQVFRLETTETSYWFRITKFGHLEHIYYGSKLKSQNVEALLHKRTAVVGSSIVYDPSINVFN